MWARAMQNPRMSLAGSQACMVDSQCGQAGREKGSAQGRSGDRLP